MRLIFYDDVPNAFDKSCRIELGTKDLIRAVGADGNPPITDKRHDLSVLSGFDLGAKPFRIGYS